MTQTKILKTMFCYSDIFISVIVSDFVLRAEFFFE